MLFAETGFDARETVWNGLGREVQGAKSSAEAIKLAGIDWKVVQKKMTTEDGINIKGYYANVRDSDNKVLGIVGERYKIVQNNEAFEFTDELLGQGVKYETAGSLNGGKRIWLLAKTPNDYKILGDSIEPYLVFTNTHDGTGSIKVAMTPVRVVCKNTLNLALKKADRAWSARHTGNINEKLNQARQTLELADLYMQTLNQTFEELYKVKLDDKKVIELVDNLIPVDEDASTRMKENKNSIKSDIIFRYEEAPDLKDREKTGARFIQAVTDSVGHMEPKKLSANRQENFFNSMILKNELADRAMNLVLAAA